MNRTITISYSWRNAEGTPIPLRHTEPLEEDAMERITKMLKEGYVSGELHSVVRTDEADGEDGVEYSGSWEVVTTPKEN